MKTYQPSDEGRKIPAATLSRVHAASYSRTVCNIRKIHSQHQNLSFTTSKIIVRNIKNTMKNVVNDSSKNEEKNPPQHLFHVDGNIQIPHYIAKCNIHKTHLQHACETYATSQHLRSL
jgi:hypothetical protein